ncbi:MAG: DUF3618 domain-containing protein [Thioalkalivibrio sp.]|nr:DUF3618 domain-containing protein [Thioalkalivibrio sp.]
MADQKDRRSSQEIEQDLKETRREMHDAVDALEDKLTIGQLLEKAWAKISGDRSVRTVGANAGAVARDHPIPLALMGLGVAWLAIEKATSSNSDHDDNHADGPSKLDKAKDKLSGAAEVAKDWTGDVGDTGHHLVDRAKDGVHQVGEQARRRGSQVKNGFWSAMEEQPLVLGAVALGLGLASGLAVPATSWEDKTMGRAADSLKKDVKETVADAAEVATEVAGDTVVAAKEEADRQTVTGNLAASARLIADEAKDTAKQRWREESGDLKERAAHAGGRTEERTPDRRV